MRAGGATEAIWDDSARRFGQTACRYRRWGVPLMYSAPGGERTTTMRPERGILDILGLQLAAGGVSSRTLTVPSKHRNTQETKNS